MMSKLLQRLKDSFFGSGAATACPQELEPGSHFYTDSEIASIKQRRAKANAAAKAVIKRAGVTVHPRLAARARRREQILA